MEGEGGSTSSPPPFFPFSFSFSFLSSLLRAFLQRDPPQLSPK